MTLVSSIIRDAYRETNLIAISAEPTTAEQEEALRLLNRIVASVYGTEAGELLTSIPIGRNNISTPAGYPWYDGAPPGEWYVPSNSRLVLNLTEATTVYLNPAPQDGDRLQIVDASSNLATNNLTIVGNGQKINSAASATVQDNNATIDYHYRADLANWLIVSPLALNTEMPFGSEFDDLFIIMLAARLSPRHAQPITDESRSRLAQVMKAFKTRYHQAKEVGPDWAVVATPGTQRRYYIDTRLANSAFTSGLARLYSRFPW